ncbi:hypothetical protein JMJ77_0005088 [Colletotrichum scovillei]|uniref:Uncharacterized protein n=1 Tax=Colletotrichum scovillei TaxID=1209932 RepID=A0A9P7RG19_9PEZI|nr:hypothetical protein JMJ77_0005088 [Colletotrichum scovillei]KAG7076292.1 hypothetical protein JMJ76_0013558 [Colletotrichum scovillei]KAG7083377.1 hypothetical protein JMJ78_0008823 [Colletotrichum scovillei]
MRGHDILGNGLGQRGNGRGVVSDWNDAWHGISYDERSLCSLPHSHRGRREYGYRSETSQ